MNKFAVVIPYYGTFKPSITLFLESCIRNKNIDWFFFTDCSIPKSIQLTSNIKWYETDLQFIKDLFKNQLKREVVLERPYKLCDLKPFYGLIFQDYLLEYEYWGFGDTDVIYGNLYEYLIKINYKSYDKINWMGHLCFVRNTDVCNDSVFTQVDGTISAEDILLSEYNIGFDERDYNLKFLANGLKIYQGKWAADIDIYYWRMRCVDWKTLCLILSTKGIKWTPRNYSKQMFISSKGRIYRVYLKYRKVHFEEFAYIHYRKEVPIKLSNVKESSFIITREGFEVLDYSQSELYDYNLALKLINKYNNQENYIQEMICFLYHYKNKIIRKHKDKV